MIGAFLVLFMICGVAAGAGAADPSLPDDESQAIAWLESGWLDSALWRAVQPFYRQPISVPQGELRYLMDLMPERFEELPLTPDQLARYEPWDRVKVEAFFRDHPDLVAWEPVLSFRASRVAQRGVAGWALKSITLQSRAPTAGATFSLRPNTTFQTNGSIEVTDHTAQWLRRSFAIMPAGAGRIQLGNFSLVQEEGLLLGRFPPAPALSSPAQSWLNAEIRTWNGVCWTGSPLENTSVAVFTHSRPTETVAGAQAYAAAGRYLGIDMGFFGADLRGDGLPVYGTVQTGVRLLAVSWKARLLVGLSQHSPTAVPFYGSVAHGTGFSRFSGDFVSFPGGFMAPLSREFAAIRHELALADTQDPGPVHRARLAFEHRITGELRVSPGMGFIISERGVPVDGWIEATGTKPLQYRVSYLFRSRGFDVRKEHRIRASLRHGWDFLSLALRASGVFPDTGSASASVTGTAAWRPKTVPIEFSVFTRLSTGLRAPGDAVVGCAQRLMLFERTSGEFAIETPVGKGREREFRAASSFHFFL